MFGITQDITEQKKIQDSFIESQSFNETLLNTSPDIIYIYDIVESKNVYSNEGISKILGYSVNEVQEMGSELIPSLMHKDDFKNYINEILPKYQHAKDGDLIEHEYRMQHKNGNWHWLHSKESIFKRLPDGSPKQIFGMISDITKRKLTDIEIQNKNAYIESIMDNMPIGFGVNTIDDGEVKYLNNQFENIYGWPKDVLSNVSVFFEKVFADPMYREKIKTQIVSDMQSGDPKRMVWDNLRIVTSKGEERIVKAYNIPLIDQNIMISTVQDVTEQKQAEKELKEIEWLLEKEKKESSKTAKNYIPDYGDVTKLNTERTILDNVGAVTMKTLCSDIMDLLDTSIAIYEKNGDYAYGQFDSSWCQTLDIASFRLCNTQDSKKALNCGKWLCHENCWNDSAKEAIITQNATDIECIGGIHLYGVPIFAGGEIIGAINMGYGNPPSDEKTLKELSEKYHLEYEALAEEASKYKARPPFIIENAKKRLHTVAQLIGKIVDNAQKEKQITESEQKFKDQVNFLDTIINQSPFAMWISDAAGTMIRSNHSLHKILNVTDDQLIGKYNVLDDENLYEQGLLDAVKAVYEDNQPARFVMYWAAEKVGRDFEDTNVRSLWIDVSLFPIIGENGKLLNVVCQYVDITDRKQAEEELFQSLQREQLQADIVRNSPIAIALGYPDGRLDNCNRAFTNLVGYSEEELKVISWNEVLTPSKWNDIEAEELKKLSPENNIVHYEKEYIHKNGSIIPIDLVVSAKFDEENNLLYFIGFVSDITELKKHREHLEQLVKERTRALEEEK